MHYIIFKFLWYESLVQCEPAYVITRSKLKNQQALFFY